MTQRPERTNHRRSTSEPDPPRWASLEEGAQHWRVSVRTMRRFIADGVVTGYRVGPRQIRVDLNELDAAMKPIPSAKVSA